MSAITEIYQWQVDAGNASRPYSDFLESSFQIEEALEGFSSLEKVAYELGGSAELLSSSPKEVSRAIVKLAQSGVPGKEDEHTEAISDVDRLDKACDAIVFAIGSMAKLGLNADQINEALLIVNEANKAKLDCDRDEHGKLMKPADFLNPEPLLQQLLK